jgi:acyl-CoA thioesterase FadM
VRLVDLGGASLTLQQEVRRGAEVLATATVTVACVERTGVRPQRLPRDMTDSLRAARDNN